ncbi:MULTISPECIES: DUF397 domain-containing protein [Streptomyces]|uniref:DUF397 domain-containing protein n=1 Tax=Streptomyces rimosus subsp. rimosus TaxID=132474 RepID=A0ABY3Z2P9_STRRM|nr:MULTISPECIES: DUF397 domain-containing protein [Streptomyces]KEF02596.1 hypothetical protein DF17_32800 [Streptomyces rimosus]UNZ02754.1 hypothetical protein SRIMR7_11430 [Streptomyces rimosus subsp. rimosus]UTH94307.1 hypothetical protein SRIMHP_09265 [Streptomyces rimosus subsp. rimosus]UTJ12403.1 hypothetical protein SRIMDV3_09165 [Streptomyces rimosus subsp. rimosus]
MKPDTSRLTWQKSSYSNEGGDCIYVAAAPDGTVRLRESDDPEVIVSATRHGLTAFLAVTKESGVERTMKGWSPACHA